MLRLLTVQYTHSMVEESFNPLADPNAFEA